MITELFQEYDKAVSIITDTNDEATVEYIIEKYGLTNLDF